jgi:hypothetical protein
MFSATTAIPIVFLSLFAHQILSIPLIIPRDSSTCYITGPKPLPTNLQHTISTISEPLTCDHSRKTIAHIPDVSTSTISFSHINFHTSPLPPLEYALRIFQTPTQLSRANLRRFERYWEVYVATEAGVRSEGLDSVKIQIPRLFLELQVARIKASRGIRVPDDAVDGLVGAILREARGEDRMLLDHVVALGTPFGRRSRQRPLGGF